MPKLRHPIAVNVAALASVAFVIVGVLTLRVDVVAALAALILAFVFMLVAYQIARGKWVVTWPFHR